MHPRIVIYWLVVHWWEFFAYIFYKLAYDCPFKKQNKTEFTKMRFEAEIHNLCIDRVPPKSDAVISI